MSGNTTAQPLDAVEDAVEAQRLIRELDPVGDIEDRREAGGDGGNLMGFFCRGHAGRYDFAVACNKRNGALTHYDARHVRADECYHVWWRTVPMSGDPGCSQYVPAEPGARGAWRATVWEGVARSRLFGMRDYIATDRAGHRRGFAEGVNWAIQALQNRRPEAADHLVAVWRAKGDLAEERHLDTGASR